MTQSGGFTSSETADARDLRTGSCIRQRPDLPTAPLVIHMYSLTDELCGHEDLSSTAQDPALAELDNTLFGPPYIYIAADNTAVAAVHERRAHAGDRPVNAVSIVGTLHPAACGIDIDPSDTGAPPEAGHAFGDALVSWCERLGFPWLRRSSGRPGHLHLIALVPPELRQELRNLCAQLARHHAISATVRSTLRLTAAPHRLGFASPIIDGTLEARDLPAPTRNRPRLCARSRPHLLPSRSPHARSRSEGEYGDALGRARALWTTDQAWRAANRPGSKAAEIGKQAWQRWFWAPAQTIVDAERGLLEDVAWRHFTEASPVQARYLGNTRWRTERWLPALEEARTDRPRRRRTSPTQQQSPAGPSSDQRNKIALTRRLLRITASLHLLRSPATQASVKPATLYAALDAIATAIVTRSGSMSVRSWAERSLLDPKSVRRARDTAELFGLIHRTHSYHGGPNDCDSWQLTKRLADLLSRLLTQSPTILYTPHTLSLGSANYQRLRRTHLDEQTLWRSAWKELTKRHVAHTINASPFATYPTFHHQTRFAYFTPEPALTRDREKVGFIPLEPTFVHERRYSRQIRGP